MTALQRSRIMELRNQGSGYRQIATALNLSPNTVKAYLRRIQSAELAAGEAICKHCGKRFEKLDRQTHQVFCSPKCRILWWQAHPGEMRRLAVTRFICQHCGVAFEDYSSAQRKYCSLNCYREHRRKGEHNGY